MNHMEEREDDEIHDDFGDELTHPKFTPPETETVEESEFRREAFNQKHLTDSLSGLI